MGINNVLWDLRVSVDLIYADELHGAITFSNKSPPTAVVQENTAKPFCCEDLENVLWHLFSLRLWRRKLSFSSPPHLSVGISLYESQHRWMPVWCFFHLSNFWLISQLHYADACFRSSTQHSSLCANGLSASLRLGVQLRGDSLISHLAVLFLSCRVIMPAVDGRVRKGSI